MFIFNIEHPIFTAGVKQGWIYTEAGIPQYWPVDNYFIPGMKDELRRPMMLLVKANKKQRHTVLSNNPASRKHLS